MDEQQQLEALAALVTERAWWVAAMQGWDEGYTWPDNL